jgi:post-segregation antitoxin (ccd killing protein)
LNKTLTIRIDDETFEKIRTQNLDIPKMVRKMLQEALANT